MESKMYKNLEEGRKILMDLYPERKAEFEEICFCSSRFDSIADALEDIMYNSDYYGAETDVNQYYMESLEQEKQMRVLLHQAGYAADAVNVGFYSGNIYPLDTQDFLFSKESLPEVVTVEAVKGRLLELAEKWLSHDGAINVYITTSQVGRYPYEKDKDFKDDDVEALLQASEELDKCFCVNINKDNGALNFYPLAKQEKSE